MFQPVEFDCNLSPTVFFKDFTHAAFLCLPKDERHLADDDQGNTDKQTADKYNIRKALSLTYCAGGLWADGIWKTGSSDTPICPYFFTRHLFLVLPLSLHCHPPTYRRRAEGTRHTNSNNLATESLQEASCILVHINLSNCISFLKCIVTQS